MKIEFHYQHTTFRLKNKRVIKKKIFYLLQKEKQKAELLSIAFCSDAFLYSLNKKFLKHNTLTDIITFQYSEEEISGEIFISIPRVRANAKELNVIFESELQRVILHGILHLCGYKDKKISDKKKMRAKEDFYLQA